jgi:hypothetical protein
MTASTIPGPCSRRTYSKRARKTRPRRCGPGGGTPGVLGGVTRRL